MKRGKKRAADRPIFRPELPQMRGGFPGIFRSAESNFERFLGPWNEGSCDDASGSEMVVSVRCQAKKFPRETNFRPISERHFGIDDAIRHSVP
jgi:hypothetical protein